MLLKETPIFTTDLFMMALHSPMTSLPKDGYNNDESVDVVQSSIKIINNSMSAALDLFRDVLSQTSRVLFKQFVKDVTNSLQVKTR